MPTVFLADRALVSVDGPDAEHLLQNIVTTDLDGLSQGEAKPGALLTPQGKVLFDFLVSRQGEDGLRLECRRDIADDLVRRLTLYRLRAKAQITKQDQVLVEVSWDCDSRGSDGESGRSSTDSSAGNGEADQWLADRRFGERVRRRAVPRCCMRDTTSCPT